MNEIVTNTKTPQEPTKPENVTDSYHILLADDDLEMRRMLAWSLRDKGFVVTECNDGDCLMKQLGFLGPLGKTETFDLIISDIRMPGVTGMQVLESSKVYEDFPPIILITAFGDEVTHARAKKLDAAAILDKPFNIDDLLAKVAQILPSHLRSAEQQRVSSREKTPIAQFPVDIKFLHGCESDPARDLILRLAGKLDRFEPPIQHLHVVIDQSILEEHRKRRYRRYRRLAGKPDRFETLIQPLHVVIDQSIPEEHRKRRYRITLTATVQRKILFEKYNSDKNNGHENLYLSILIAFSALYRQVKKHHNKLKSHKSHSRFKEEGAQ